MEQYLSLQISLDIYLLCLLYDHLVILKDLKHHYLLLEKRPGGTAADSVAHFHLNNGAGLEQLNWQADLSERGLKQSNGIMLNYLYDLKTIDSNHESYRAGKPVIASAALQNLLKD